MVSFQCDGCTDVVKKPKLDQHRARCGASFTCIDCSQTFQTPVDWKGHTSCISEAQKYQKTLYKPKTNGGGRENYSGSRGGFQGRGGSWNRPPPRSQATGANGTPLGTPPRMSPVTAPPPVEEEKNAVAVPPPVADETKLNEKPPKTHKKRKPEATNIVQVEGVGGSIAQEEPKSKEKEEKKEKKEKKKKDKHDKAIAPETTVKDVESTGVSLPSASEAAPDEKPKKSKKSKKDKKKESDVVETQDLVQDPPEQAAPGDTDNADSKEEKKKKKKRKSEMLNGDVEVNGDPSLSTDATLEKRSKKRKREADEQAGDVAEQAHGGTGKKEKKKKKTTSV